MNSKGSGCDSWDTCVCWRRLREVGTGPGTVAPRAKDNQAGDTGPGSGAVCWWWCWGCLGLTRSTLTVDEGHNLDVKMIFLQDQQKKEGEEKEAEGSWGMSS